MLSLDYLPLDSLIPATRNPKRHHADVESSLARFGLGDVAGVVDGRTGKLLAGHGRVEALRSLQRRGAEVPRGVDDRAGVWFVPVLNGWSSRDDTEAEALLLALNELTKAGGWNPSELEVVLKDLGEEQAAGLGFDEGLLASIFGSSEDQEEEEEKEPAEPEVVWVKEGETFALGNHRLHVGDSLTKEGRSTLFASVTFADLVVGDPPYAIFGSSSGVGNDVADDKMIVPFFESVFVGIEERLRYFGHLYLFTDWRSWASLWQAAKRVRTIVPKNGLIWNKGSGLGSNYMCSTESIFFAHKLEPQKSAWLTRQAGIRPVHKSSVLNYPRPTGNERLHNAAKPVPLLVELLENSSDPGAYVWDPFCGSGSTMIAAEKSGRRALMGEIDPKNAQIAIERWQKLTGERAVRVG